jgi:pre-rRNA-processing protein TSR4
LITRYSFGGCPLWISEEVPKSIPSCSNCGSKRVFEMQLMPTILTFGLEMTVGPKNIEFGVVAVYSCSKSCSKEGYTKEYAFVQAAL